MDLLCYEAESECRAFVDPALINDERVLQNLLKNEERYIPNTAYFDCVQHDVTEQMRKIVAEWMLEVCEEQKCQEEVFPLSMNYMDRFLSVCRINKTELQLLGTACLLLASKLREPRPFAAATLVFYTDNSITMEQLRSWELLVLAKLKWDVCAVTPQDFLRHILCRLSVRECDVHIDMVLRHAQTFIALAARDLMFSRYLPSTIASAALAAALHGLGWTDKQQGLPLPALLQKMHHITATEQDYLESCLLRIEDMVSSTLNKRSTASSSSTHQQPHQHSQSQQQQQKMVLDGSGGGGSGDSQGVVSVSADKLQEHEKAGTPTDVREVHF